MTMKSEAHPTMSTVTKIYCDGVGCKASLLTEPDNQSEIQRAEEWVTLQNKKLTLTSAAAPWLHLCPKCKLKCPWIPKSKPMTNSPDSKDTMP